MDETASVCGQPRFVPAMLIGGAIEIDRPPILKGHLRIADARTDRAGDGNQNDRPILV
jgi:hypothetical protein